jgi:hypothetical protein
MRYFFHFLCIFLVISLVFCVLCPQGFAIGMAGGQQFVTLKKGLQVEYNYPIMGAQHMSASIYGTLPNLSKYATLVDPDPRGGDRTLTVKLNFMDELPPGKYKVYIRATEEVDTVGTIVARTAIEAVINVLVLFPGKFVDWTTSAKDINVNESTYLEVFVRSLGTEKINELKAKFDVYDEQGKLLQTVYSNITSLDSDTTAKLVGSFPATNWPKGNYYYNASLIWDGKEEAPKTGIFRIGTLTVNIKGYTKEFIIDAVNLFQVTIESDWSGIIKDVYAEIKTPNKNLKTPTLDIQDFNQGTIETYWDTTGIKEKEVPVTITVVYAGKKTTQDVIVYINKTGKGVEPPKANNFFTNLSTTTFILVIAILLLVANFIYFFIRSRKNEKKS